MNSHEAMMARAIRLAERGCYTTDPNPRVGCVIVNQKKIVGEGWHQKAGEAHAEIHALQHAGPAAKGATCYVTLEPCSHFGRTPPCALSLIEAGIKCVYIGVQDPNPQVSGKGIQLLKEAGIEVQVGLLQEEAQALNPGFFMRMTQGRPYVTSKIAMSLDGRTALSSGESKWITCPASREDVHRLRARSSAILTGTGTVLADDPALTVRLGTQHYPAGMTIRQPWRIVMGNRPIPDASQLATQPERLIQIVSQSHTLKVNHQIIQVDDDNGKVDLHAMMRALAKLEINELLVEAGSQLNGALMQAGLVDQWIFYMAPKIMGDAAKGLFHFPALQHMEDTLDLSIQDIRRIDKDWRITARAMN